MAKEQEKKEQEKRIKKDSSSNKNIKEVIIVIVIILVFFLLVYLLTVFLTSRKSNEITSNASVQYSKIIVGEVMDMNEEKYLVFLFDSEGDNASDYTSLVSTYREKDKHLTLYTVDLNEGLNKKYISEEENIKVDNIKDIKVKGDTLLLVENGKITDYTTSSFNEYLDNHVE